MLGSVQGVRVWCHGALFPLEVLEASLDRVLIWWKVSLPVAVGLEGDEL